VLLLLLLLLFLLLAEKPLSLHLPRPLNLRAFSIDVVCVLVFAGDARARGQCKTRDEGAHEVRKTGKSGVLEHIHEEAEAQRAETLRECPHPVDRALGLPLCHNQPNPTKVSRAHR